MEQTDSSRVWRVLLIVFLGLLVTLGIAEAGLAQGIGIGYLLGTFFVVFLCLVLGVAVVGAILSGIAWLGARIMARSERHAH